MRSFYIWFRFSGYLVLYAVGEKGTRIEQTSTHVVLSAVCVSLWCIEMAKIEYICTSSTPQHLYPLL
jgi:hypothetical protein